MDLESVCVKEKERKEKKETADFASQAAAAASRLFYSSFFLPLHRFVCYVLVILLLHLLLCAMQRRWRWRFLFATPTAAAAAVSLLFATWEMRIVMLVFFRIVTAVQLSTRTTCSALRPFEHTQTGKEKEREAAKQFQQRWKRFVVGCCCSPIATASPYSLEWSSSSSRIKQSQ